MNLDLQDLSFQMDVNVLVGLLGVLRKRTQLQEFPHGPILNTNSIFNFCFLNWENTRMALTGMEVFLPHWP